jgi:hypothetical protein
MVYQNTAFYSLRNTRTIVVVVVGFGFAEMERAHLE